MKKLLSCFCAAAMALSLTNVFAADAFEKQYTPEGGYTYIDDHGKTIYVGTDDTRYRLYLFEDGKTAQLYYVSTRSGDAIVPETINGIKITSVSGFDGRQSTLKNLVIPDTVTHIEHFNGCENLKTVKLPNTLTEIDEYTFSGCKSLESINIPSSITEIKNATFSNCASLKKVEIPSNVIKIGSFAFSACPLESIELPTSLIKIGEGAFDDNKKVKTITIPENVKSIDKYAFRNTSLEKVIFKGTVESIGRNTFSCEHLNEVVGLSNEDIVKFWTSFSNTPWQTTVAKDVGPLLIDTDGRLVAYIGTETDIKLPDTVKKIGESAFVGKPITNVEIPNTTTEIEKSAFYNCEELRSITIPASVNKIGNMAFSHCYRLKYITFEYSDTTLSLESAAFQFTLASPKTLVTNNRKYTNQKSAFMNTYFDDDYVPVSKNGVSYDDEYVEPTESPEATQSPQATQSPEPTATPNVTESPTIEPTSNATETITVKSQDDKVSVWTNEKEIVFEDAQPFIDKNERTQIPIRAVAETLNCKVDWDGENHIVTITKDSDTVKIVIGSNIMTINGKEITMDTTAEVISDRTYIPIRFVGEALGTKVEWGM